MTEQGPVRVVVADDQASVRDGLVALLGLLPGIEVVGAACDGAEALAAVGRLTPDVLLLDLRMPGQDGVETIRRITAEHPGTAVVVLTGYADDDSVVAALAAGATGFLTKNAGRREIGQAVTAAAAGLAPLSAEVQRSLVTAARFGRPAAQPPDGLTARETEVLVLLAAGLSNRAISARLHIEPVTVKSHINRIFAKTGATDRKAATAYARDHGLIA